MEDQSSQKPKQNKSDNNVGNIMRYAGLAFQMMATLGLAVFIGYKLDQKIGWRFPVCLIVFSLGGLVVTLRQILNDTRRK
ncbi:AtpZ/AtpI family protein [Chitinophaga sp. sic0106]|nr:AtpZ/AtpI family protein [Chitinophaga sp. sic0106]